MSNLKKYIPKVVDITLYSELDDQSKSLIIKAENCHEDSLIEVSSDFIFGKNGFPQNVNTGIQYLSFGNEKGIMKATEQYGTHLLLGEYVEKDEEKAIELLNKVATKRRDSNKKLFLVEIMLSHQTFDINLIGKVSNVNYVLAKQICKEAVELGNAKAMFQYGKLCMMHHRNKYGKIKADFREAFEYFVMSSQKGDSDGMLYHGKFLESGFGGAEIDLDEAAKLYKKSYEKGNLAGYALYGSSLISCNKIGNLNEIEGLRLIKYSCDQNCPCGINSFACLVYYGVAGVEKDEKRAFDYFKKAADLGFYAAFNKVGTFYRDGKVVEQDIDLAIKCFRFAYKGGSLQAAYNLAIVFSDEKYNRIDKKKAARLFKKSFNFGYVYSLNCYCSLLINDEENLEKNATELKKYLDIGRSINDVDTMNLQAKLYMDGKVYDKNQQLGVQILKECAELGSKDAISELIQIYEKGIDGIKPNEKEAQKYRNMIRHPKSQSCLLI